MDNALSMKLTHTLSLLLGVRSNLTSTPAWKARRNAEITLVHAFVLLAQQR
jgi:hypothetical protein